MSSQQVPKPKRNTEDAMRDAAKALCQLLERELAERMPSWTVKSTPRGLGVDVREGEDPVALVWWDKDGWWCKRWPTPPKQGVEPIHDMDEWTVGSIATWIVENNPAKPRPKPGAKP